MPNKKQNFVAIKFKNGKLDKVLLQKACTELEVGAIEFVRRLTDNSVLFSVRTQAEAEKLTTQLVLTKLENGTTVTANLYEDGENDEEAESGSDDGKRSITMRADREDVEEDGARDSDAVEEDSDDGSRVSGRRQIPESKPSRKSSSVDAERRETSAKSKRKLVEDGDKFYRQESHSSLSRAKNEGSVSSDIRGRQNLDEEDSDDASSKKSSASRGKMRNRGRVDVEEEQEDFSDKEVSKNVSTKRKPATKQRDEIIESLKSPAKGTKYLASVMALEAFVRLSGGEEPTAELLASIVADCKTGLSSVEGGMNVEVALQGISRFSMCLEETTRLQMLPHEFDDIDDDIKDAYKDAGKKPVAVLLECQEDVVLVSMLDGEHFVLFDVSPRGDVFNAPYFFVDSELMHAVKRLRKIFPTSKTGQSKETMLTAFFVKRSKRQAPKLDLAKLECDLLQDKVRKLQNQIKDVEVLDEQLRELNQRIKKTERQIDDLRSHFRTEFDNISDQLRHLVEEDSEPEPED